MLFRSVSYDPRVAPTGQLGGDQARSRRSPSVGALLSTAAAGSAAVAAAPSPKAAWGDPRWTLRWAWARDAPFVAATLVRASCTHLPPAGVVGVPAAELDAWPAVTDADGPDPCVLGCFPAVDLAWYLDPCVRPATGVGAGLVARGSRCTRPGLVLVLADQVGRSSRRSATSIWRGGGCCSATRWRLAAGS